MSYYKQTDPMWFNDLMTSPLDLPNLSTSQKNARWKTTSAGFQGDILGRWGCLVTSLTNITNLYYDESYTPSEYNKKIRIEKGYYALHFGYDCDVGKESFLVWDIVKDIFRFKVVNFNIDKSKVDIKSVNKFYIVRVPYSPPKIMSGHYNFLVGAENGLKHFDVDNGTIRVDWGKSPEYQIHEVVF